ncbi:uncharacterized protein [Linepithema humile]|uniref:uncharacterized protein n=1 Tax=Linepithema humile TaxID=83485 RepID=UPI00351E9DD9
MPKKRIYANKKGSRASTSRASRSSIKRRQPLNRYSLEGETESVSTSAKKLKTSTDDYEIHVNKTFGYCFINFVTVFTSISQLIVCKTCGSNIKFEESSCRGLGFKIAVICEKCVPKYINSSPLINNHAYDINRRMVFTMRLLGIGINGIKKFCAFMCLPIPVYQSFYDKIISNIRVATNAVCGTSIKRAAAKEKEMSLERGQIDGITVSGDGTWRKRGFSSLFGVVSLIGWCTGKVVDIAVKSKFCKACSLWNGKQNTSEYEEWAANHEANCERNHEGSSGKMEVDAVIEMFQRSEKLHNLKYSHYIGDGDSKTFKGILDSKPYDDLNVCKKECIDHVQKRMGTRLRNLKKNIRGLGGRGKLTGKLIDELTIYYGLAIRRNPNSIEDMRREIWATLFHKISTDSEPQHDRCPVGENSWCSWQQAKAHNELHHYQHKAALNNEVFKAVQPIYEELSRDELLSRCVGGFTQNSNESFNSVLWAIAPKIVHSNKAIVDIAANIAVCNFNDGLHSIMEIMQVLNLIIGSTCYNFCVETDERRIRAAERAMTKEAQEARRQQTSARKATDDEYINVEGQLYGAGIAD